MTQPATKRLVTEASALAKYVVHVPDATGTAATDRANVIAAHDTLPAAGGRIVLGRGDYDLTGGFTLSKPIILQGHGVAKLDGSAAARIVSTSTTADCITVTADGCGFQDLTIINTAATDPTAGAAIRLTAGTYARVSRVNVSQFYDGLSFDSGSYWVMSDCAIVDPVRYGVLIKASQGSGDWGDQSIHGCHFTTFNKSRSPQCAVRYESGGGLRFVNNKIVSGFTSAYRFVNGLELAIADGVSTGDLFINANSVEGCTGSQVKIGQKGPLNTGNFPKIVITANEFLGSSPIGASQGITVAAATTADAVRIRDVLIASNIFDSLAVGISAQSMTSLVLGKNEFVATNVGGPTVTTPISIGNAVTGYDIDRQSYGNSDACDLIVDAHNATATPGQRRGLVDYSDGRDINASGVSTPYKLWQFDLPSSGAVTVTLDIDGVTVDGSNSTRNGVVLRQERTFTRDQAGSNIAVATIGTDFSTGTNAATTQIVWTQTSTTVTAAVQTTDATMTKVQGNARINVRGTLSRFHRGA